MSECQKCGECCRYLSATLTPSDLNREPRLRRFLVPIHQVGNPKTRAFMAEKKMPWAIKKPHRGAPCPFLGADNLCAIHSTRPQICRDYPQGAKCLREEQKCLQSVK